MAHSIQSWSVRKPCAPSPHWASASWPFDRAVGRTSRFKKATGWSLKFIKLANNMDQCEEAQSKSTRNFYAVYWLNPPFKKVEEKFHPWIRWLWDDGMAEPRKFPLLMLISQDYKQLKGTWNWQIGQTYWHWNWILHLAPRLGTWNVSFPVRVFERYWSGDCWHCPFGSAITVPFGAKGSI